MDQEERNSIYFFEGHWSVGEKVIFTIQIEELYDYMKRFHFGNKDEGIDI